MIQWDHLAHFSISVEYVDNVLKVIIVSNGEFAAALITHFQRSKVRYADMCTAFAILPICAVIVSFTTCVLELIALPSDYWGYFATRRIRGIPEESGHFGLWRLCSVKGDSQEEICLHPDSTTQLPTHAAIAAAVSIIHLLMVGSFCILSAIRLLQLARNKPDLYLGTKRLCIVKVSLALICVILSISVSILASVGEGRYRQYTVLKGWAFWIQIIIISFDIVLLLVCAFENIQYWQQRMTEPPPRDPTDEFPETFVTPDYDLPPELKEEKIVYVKDASVQSQLDGYTGNFSTDPEVVYNANPKQERNKIRRSGSEVSDVHFDNRGATVITISSQDSPHPRKR